MTKGARPLWTTGRKLAGNLVPLILSVPLLVYGVMQYPGRGFAGPTLVGLFGFLIVAWLATNFLGPIGGWGLRGRVEALLQRERPFEKAERVFVGFARPNYQGLLDPHEDVGFLLIHPDSLEFFGATQRVEVARADVTGVVFRPNPHSWVWLGRWVSVEASTGKGQLRLLVEPREKATLLGNRLYGKALKARLLAWKETGTAPSADPVAEPAAKP